MITTVADLRSLPLPDCAFTLVVSNYAFHHLDHSGKALALSEARRVLRPGGRLVVGDMMFALSLRPRDRRLVAGKIIAIARRGPAGAVRLARNAARLGMGRWEHPESPENWEQLLAERHFWDISVLPLAHEGGIATARRPPVPLGTAFLAGAVRFRLSARSSGARSAGRERERTPAEREPSRGEIRDRERLQAAVPRVHILDQVAGPTRQGDRVLSPVRVDDGTTPRAPRKRPADAERDPGHDRMAVSERSQHRRKRPAGQVLRAAVALPRDREKRSVVHAVAAALDVPDEPELWIPPDQPSAGFPCLERRCQRQRSLQPLLPRRVAQRNRKRRRLAVIAKALTDKRRNQ